MRRLRYTPTRRWHRVCGLYRGRVRQPVAHYEVTIRASERPLEELLTPEQIDRLDALFWETCMLKLGFITRH